MSRDEARISDMAAFGKGRFLLTIGIVDILIVALLLAAVGALFMTASRDGDFWWADGPTHAMDGVFVHDFIVAMPWKDPIGYAVNYFIKYPALTVVFYPPLFTVA